MNEIALKFEVLLDSVLEAIRNAYGEDSDEFREAKELYDMCMDY